MQRCKALTRFIRNLLLTSFVIFLPATAIAAWAHHGQPITAEERLHQRLVQEGEQASRSAPPLPIRTLPNNGIEEIPKTIMLDSPSYKNVSFVPAAAQKTALVPAAGPKTACLQKVFPEVAWRVCVTDMGLKGLWVGPVDLRRTPTSPWMRVIYQAGLAEIFVPYEETNTFRPYDLRYTTALDQVTPADAGINGSLITLTGESIPTVVAEVRERGVAWLCKQNTAKTRRGEEFLVWGISDGGNYDNIVQYGFRDDGTITFRMGNTGYNWPAHSREAHTHNGLWRVDIDLNGAGGDSAYLLRHREPFPFSPSLLNATDLQTPFTVEGRRSWISSQFTSLLVEDTATNTFGNKLGYEFALMQPGTSRHYGTKESWTLNDFYVTAYNPNNFGWVSTWAAPDDYLLPDLNGGSVINTDLVIWIKASAHHDPIDEDRSVNDLRTGGTTGVTLVHWSGFNMEPHNLFDTNPLGGPVDCGPPPCNPITC